MTFDQRHDRQSRTARYAWAALTTDGGFASRWRDTRRIGEIRATLAATGIKLTGPHQGQLQTDRFTADVRLEPEDGIHVGCDVTGSESDAPTDLLERCAGAVGNLRFASTVLGESRLIADTRINGVSHLPRTVRDISASVADVMDGRAIIAAAAGDFPTDLFQKALHTAGWPTEDAVRQPDGYELFVVWEGARVAVQLSAVGDGLLARRTILPSVPDGDGGHAVSHQALAWNARLRGCRLALADGRLIVEAQLHKEQITGDWLSYTIRAVAGVARSLQPEVQLLASDPGVAAAYAEMFMSAGRGSPAGAVAHAASVP